MNSLISSPNRSEGKAPICIVGASPDTSNLGVSALFASMLHGLRQRVPEIPLVVFDNGLGVRQKSFRVANNCLVDVELRGIRAGLRLNRPENLRMIDWLSRIGALGTVGNANLRCLQSARAVLDISGGDSFSDIYGAKRFWSVALPKQIVLRLGVPLVLMPQTYGPFHRASFRKVATKICAAAHMAWARDDRSYATLRELLGDSFDPSRHCVGVDIAFGLQPVPVQGNWTPLQQQMLFDKQKTLIGLNVSGLIHNDPSASQRYGFQCDYRQLVREVVLQILAQTDANILLVSHVLTANELESDPMACQRVMQELSTEQLSRVTMAPTDLDQCQVKWLIGRCDWFCGTRMHATIAGLSQGVATATINYSDKARGVFESCGQGMEVFDPRRMNESSIVHGLLDSIQRRNTIRESLLEALPAVQARATAQFNQIVEALGLRSETQPASVVSSF